MRSRSPNERNVAIKTSFRDHARRFFMHCSLVPANGSPGRRSPRTRGVSPATVSQTFKHLERRDWLEVKGEGPAKRRLLARPHALLDAWRDSVPAGPKGKKKSVLRPSQETRGNGSPNQARSIRHEFRPGVHRTVRRAVLRAVPVQRVRPSRACSRETGPRTASLHSWRAQGLGGCEPHSDRRKFQKAEPQEERS